MRAYLFSCTITREKRPPRRLDEDIYSDYFREMQLYSNRSATEPRDYIFATMPQFPWYHYPREAEQMSFNSIFKDFYEKAKGAGHAFACRFTRSMTEPEQNLTVGEAWYPSGQQPEPETLGDFFKLLGQRMCIAEDGSNYHLTTSVRVTEVKIGDLAGTMELLESAMRFSFRKWHQCHQCGELTKYGSLPQGEPYALRERVGFGLYWPKKRLRAPTEKQNSHDGEQKLRKKKRENPSMICLKRQERLRIFFGLP
jgi:hypothetical protein